MIFNYLKIAYRNLLKYRFISFINLLGLTIGLACCFLIGIYILHELSYDKYNPEAKRIYRVTRSFKNPETGEINLNLGTVAPPFAYYMATDFPEIEKITRLIDNSPAPVRFGDKKFNEQSIFFADENLFDFFKLDVIEGNPKKALSDPFSVMITPEVAKKYFGNEEPMNKVLRMNNQFDLKVTGVYKPFPSNTHVHPSMMISFSTLNDTNVYGAENLRTNWGNNSFLTYLLLPANYDVKKMEAQFPAFLDRHMTQNGNSKFKTSQGTSLALQKISDIHLRSHLDYEVEQNGDIKRVYIFSVIAFFILLIACINYMNLSTARSTLRAREIGIRKAVGAQRKEIISQFLSESVLLAGIATLLALALTWGMIPWLNRISGQHLSIDILWKWQIILLLVLVPFITGLISGIYPALFMSSFKPVTVLKGLFKSGGLNISFRKVLVTLQFAISIFLIISTAVVFKQMNFMQKRSLGFDKEHIVTLPYTAELNDKFDAFRTELLVNSNIRNAGRSSRIPTGRLLDAMGARIEQADTLAPVNANIKFVFADQEFISTYGVQVVAGRGFSKDFSLDTSAFLLNEAAVNTLGFHANDEVIGKDFGYGNRKGKIIGVFHDFHFESLHQRIVPLVLLVPSSPFSYGRISIKIAGSDMPAALSHIENTWKKFLPDTPYEFTFLDENFARLYEAETKQRTLFTTFACLAILIACLGLFGLSAFAISQRIKEIGIRKVLGADVSTLVVLLSRDFMRLVIISALLAIPIAWFFMNKWLQDFAYRTKLPWWIFLIALMLAGLIAFITISFQAIKAAVANPVKSLRTE